MRKSVLVPVRLTVEIAVPARWLIPVAVVLCILAGAQSVVAATPQPIAAAALDVSAVLEAKSAVNRAIAGLRAQQNADGSWRGNVLDTGCAFLALRAASGERGEDEALTRARRWLLAWYERTPCGSPAEAALMAVVRRSVGRGPTRWSEVERALRARDGVYVPAAWAASVLRTAGSGVGADVFFRDLLKRAASDDSSADIPGLAACVIMARRLNDLEAERLFAARLVRREAGDFERVLPLLQKATDQPLLTALLASALVRIARDPRFPPRDQAAARERLARLLEGLLAAQRGDGLWTCLAGDAGSGDRRFAVRCTADAVMALLGGIRASEASAGKRLRP